MFHVQNAVKEMKRHANRISNRNCGHVYFVQEDSKLLGAVYAINEMFADMTRIQIELLDSSKISESYQRMSLHAFKVWAHFKLCGEVDLKVASTVRIGIRFSPLQF